MQSCSPEIAADFALEARELLDALGGQLVALEQDPADRGLLNEVFRAFHTIKGGAGFLGATPLVDLCHAAEEALGAARSGAIALQPGHFDAAQRALDWLQAAVDAVEQLQPLEPAPADLIAAFDLAPAADPAPRPDIRPGGLTSAGTAAANADDMISDDEFEALLDQLHGEGAPGAQPIQAAAAPPPPPSPPPAPAKPAPPARPGGTPEEREQTVRVSTRRLDDMVDLVGELVLSRNRLKTLRARLRDEELERAITALDLATARLQGAVMRTRMQPIGKVFSRFPKVARDVARALDKEVDLIVEGAETELDRNLVEALSDPLVHLVRNAIDHGIEAPDERLAARKPRAGRVSLIARQQGDYVGIEVQDDGAGIDPERLRAKAREKGLIDPDAAARLSPEESLNLLFLPGLTTRNAVSDISGRGVGMDVVQSRIRELGGQIRVDSELGRGSRFILRLPLTLAILPTLLVHAGGDPYALPLARVQEVLHAPRSALGWIDGRPTLDRRSHTLRLLDLRQWLGAPAPEEALLTIVLLQRGDTRFGLVVDEVRGREEVVIKPLPRGLRGLPGYAGATLTGDGRLALILDVDEIGNG
ncbi:MAG: chemotaxis protein CheA [Gammaproteobacteria bacterium]|nr:chemotaxis protein CheA [Gammaproteobacteria bacterium]